MSAELHAVLYASRALVPFTTVDLVDLATRAAEKNEAREVSGYLWFDGSMFLQYFEGPAATVADLEAKLRGDDRHEIIKLFRRTIPADERRFGDWHMRLMNDVARSEMHMEGVLIALLEIPDGDDAPRATSAWALTDRLSNLQAG